MILYNVFVLCTLFSSLFNIFFPPICTVSADVMTAGSGKIFQQQACLLLFLSAQSMSVNNVSFSLKVEIYLFIQITSLYPQHSFLFIVLLLNGRDQRSNHQIRSRGFIDCKCCYSDVFNGFLVWINTIPNLSQLNKFL